MKHLILTAWLVLTLIELAFARPVSLVWDAAPVSEQVVGWRIYRNNTLIAATNTPSATVTLTNEAATLTVTAIIPPSASHRSRRAQALETPAP